MHKGLVVVSLIDAIEDVRRVLSFYLIKFQGTKMRVEAVIYCLST